MKYRTPCRWWTCVGFDGEGCEALLTDQQVREMLQVGETDQHLKAPGYWQGGPAHFTYTVRVQFDLVEVPTRTEITMELVPNLKELI